MAENDIIEQEANQFAMELLMPRDWLLEDIKGGIDIGDDKALQKLAKKYGVGVALMTLRIGQLMAEPKRPKRKTA